MVENGSDPSSLTSLQAVQKGAFDAKEMRLHARPKCSDIYYAAAKEMTKRVVAGLAGHENSLGIKIVTYSDPRPPTPMVLLLKELGERAGIFRAAGVWRNHLATAKRMSNSARHR